MSEIENGAQNDIAIVGMALRVPGARSVEAFWRNLKAGVESIETKTGEQLLAAGESAAKIRRKNYVPRTAELLGFETFDAEFFGFSPKEAAIMDPQHRQFLECAWEALEDSTRTPDRISGPIGVFAGCGMGSYFYFNVCSHRALVDKTGMFLLRHTGNDKDFLATRASYAFDLHGPSVNIQTACSTSLVAVHYACQSLINGESEMALAGGVTIELPHRRGYLYQEGEILAPDGHCRAFDYRASGTVFGSGTGVVVLRRLTDAISDGDPIHAVIKATAVNNDGASKAGYLAPSVTGQAEAIVEAQTLAGVDADSIGYVECHGTGTYLGDPIEIEALTSAFRQSTDKRGFCRIGSVKSNIGHLDTAAGVVSLIKAVLAVKHGEIPPTLGYEKPNPSIDFAASPFVVNDRLVPWPTQGAPRRAGVNSLGVGGTNAHAIIEQSPVRQAGAARNDVAPQVLVLSAKSRKALDESGRRLAGHLEMHPEVALQDVARTLFEGRRHFEHRRVMTVGDRQQAIALLAQPDMHRVFAHTPVEGKSEAVFMFPGGGAQYPHMARTLYRDDPVFRRVVDEGLSYLPSVVSQEIRDVWLPASGVSGEDASTRFLRPSLQLPAILIVEVALAGLWMSWGVKPVALIGHSMGENAATCVAGVLSFEHAVNLVRLRGELFEEIPPGGMLSVALTAAALQDRLPPEVDMASINGPELCVVSGSNEALDAFRQELAKDGVEASRIPIDIAAHSRMLTPILSRFEASLQATPLSAPNIPVVSNLTGTWLASAEACDPAYWTRHLRSTVRFGEGMSILAANPSHIYIEVGPGRVLCSLAKAQGIPANQVINSLPHSDEAIDDRLHVLTALGRAWSTGLAVPLDRLWASSEARRVNLPTYAFQHQSYFLDRLTSAAAADEEMTPAKIPDLAGWGWQPVWRQSVADVYFEADIEPMSWLVFVDDTPLAKQFVERLRREGHSVATVAPGDVFTMRDRDNYVLCPEHGREGYDALVKHLAGAGALPERIVHFWLASGDESFRAGSSVFHRNQECGFYSLFFLGQAISEAGIAAPLQINVITDGMLRVGNEALPHPEKATVLGPAQVLPHEMPNISVRVVDIPGHKKGATFLGRQRDAIVDGLRELGGIARSDDWVGDLLREALLASNCNEIVAFRDRRRWTLQQAPVALAETPDESGVFRPRGVYLITGGLGELAAVCAEDLARRYGARLVLVGRTALPDRAEWGDYLKAYGENDRIGRAIAAVLRIEHAGGEVQVVRADITNAEAMAVVIAQTKAKWGTINGVLHTAGVVKDNLIALKSVSEIEEVFAPKIQGTLVLSELLDKEQLDVMVLFSSVSSDTAPAGQVDYVAANAFLNAFAESRANAATRTIAVHWGVWKDVGLAARATSRAEHAGATIEAACMPLFDRRVSASAASGDWLESRISSARHWVLNEHRLKSGHAIWPGTGYIELIAEALAEYGIDGQFEVEDLTFLRPLYVPDDTTCTLRVSLRPDAGVYHFAVDSEQGPAGSGGLQRHAEAKVRLTTATARTLDVARIRGVCNARARTTENGALRSAQEDHLSFGARWKVLRSHAYGRGEAIAKLSLGDSFVTDVENGFIVHPALLDIATGFAMELIDTYAPAASLWVPMTYGKIRIHTTLPTAIWSHVRLRSTPDLGPGYASFDVTITDEEGRVVLEVEDFTIKQLAAGTDLSATLERSAETKLAGAGHATAELPPALQRLAAQVDQGILPNEGFEALLRAVGTGKPQVVVSSIDLGVLQRAAARIDTAHATSATFERPDLGVDFVEPESEIEKVLAGFWAELLGVSKVGVHDGFFDLGGHSLVAVRLFRMIKAAFAVDFPISVLFEAPTIAQCAALIEKAGARAADPADARAGAAVTPLKPPTHLHLVRMATSKHPHRTPFFLCAGMFGNVLNLRHLATQVGVDRPVYGLQARGIFGGQAPHETFEDMARDYLAEVRSVQPQGPYLLGGFSGGGLVAYEMAQQLRAAGAKTALVVMLDTPYPDVPVLSLYDRILMKQQDVRRHGVSYLYTWIRHHVTDWQKGAQSKAAVISRRAEQLHNEEIEAAFRRALERYRGARYDGAVLLMRPKLVVAYSITGRRDLNIERGLVRDDNGWRPFVGDLRIQEVPGDHDSMVLEPSVRVLAGRLREELANADRGRTVRPMAAE